MNHSTIAFAEKPARESRGDIQFDGGFRFKVADLIGSVRHTIRRLDVVQRPSSPPL